MAAFRPRSLPRALSTLASINRLSSASLQPLGRLPLRSAAPSSSLLLRSLHSSRRVLQESAVPPDELPKGTPIGQIDRRLRITFTCTAPVPTTDDRSPGAPARPCAHRSSHEFSKRSYDKGVVIIQCPACHNRHLIADHLHWFSQTPSAAHPTGQPIGQETPRTIEDLMREKGEKVRWIDEGDDGATIEVAPDDDVETK
ncbi:hypothetical protein JCM1841_001148 [Sporobolomyces salmonicolor]